MNAENHEGHASPANDGSSKGLSTLLLWTVLKGLAIVVLSSFLALTTNALRSSGSIDLSRNYSYLAGTGKSGAEQIERE